jgi:ATP/maltotriose-dependent transcriptional regulator MalT
MGLDGQAGTDAAGTNRNPGDRRELRLDPLAGGGDDGRRGYGAVEVAEWLAGTPLSPRERLAILGLMDGWTVSEIAQATGVSTETVKTWRKRGLQKLRQTL